MCGDWKYLCETSDIPDGEARGFDVYDEGDTSVFLIRSGKAFYAYLDICPHYGRTRLAWKRDAYLSGSRARIQCAAHGAQFSIEDGVCKVGPCLGQKLLAAKIDLRGTSIWISRKKTTSMNFSSTQTLPIIENE